MKKATTPNELFYFCESKQFMKGMKNKLTHQPNALSTISSRMKK